MILPVLPISISQLERKNPEVFSAFYRNPDNDQTQYELTEFISYHVFREGLEFGSRSRSYAYVTALEIGIKNNPNTPLWQHFKNLKEQGWSL